MLTPFPLLLCKLQASSTQARFPSLSLEKSPQHLTALSMWMLAFLLLRCYSSHTLFAHLRAMAILVQQKVQTIFGLSAEDNQNKSLIGAVVSELATCIRAV
jgi:hypothetical protein